MIYARNNRNRLQIIYIYISNRSTPELESTMKLHFWGTRGSLPVSIKAFDVRKKVYLALEAARGKDLKTKEAINKFVDHNLPFSVSNTYGCNTSCVEILNSDSEYIICDAGSGIRDFAVHLMKSGKRDVPTTYHIFQSHLHWDHIQGFPFFTPIYFSKTRIIFHGYHENLPEVIKNQMSAPCFPVEFSSLPSKIEFDIKKPCEPFSVAGFNVTGIEQNHPGKSYGFRFEKDDKAVVYSTDSEHKKEAYENTYPFIKFIEDADLVIFDAQYSLADATFSKSDWGHSSNVMAVELASRGRIKHLCLFHNEPNANDTELDEFLFNTRMYGDIFYSESLAGKKQRKFPQTITLAYDGLEIEV